MSFEKLLCAVIAVYVLFNFVVLPRLTKAWNANRTVSKVAKAGLLAAVQFVRDTAFVAAIIYLGFALLTLLLRFSFGHNAELLKWTVVSASHLHEMLKKINDFWSDWFFLFPLALIVYVYWRTERNEIAGRFERLTDDELDRLNEERARNPQQWSELAADEKMRAAEEQIAKAQERLAALAQQGSESKTERRQLLRLVLALNEKRRDLDYERRMKLEQFDVQEDNPTEQPAWRRILLSKGLLSDLKGFSKLLNRVTLAMLSVALIGVAGTAGLTKDVWARVIHLDELRVDARKNAAEKRWRNHPPAPQNANLNETDRQAINRLANDFSRALSRNPNWQSFRNSVRAEENLEQAIARRAILNNITLRDVNGEERHVFSDGLSAGQNELLDDLASNRQNESRLSHIVADQHGSEIKAWFGEKWDSVKVAIIQHNASYQQPVRMDDLQGELIDRIVSTAFDASESEGSSDWMKQARDGMSDATKEAVRQAVETEFHQAVEDLYDGKPYGETIEKVRTSDIPFSKAKVEDLAVLMRDRKLPDERNFAQRMAADTGTWKNPDSSGGSGPSSGAGPDIASGPRPHRPPESGPTGPTPSGSTATMKASESASSYDAIVRDIAQQTTNHGEYTLPQESVGALAEYEDHFPRSVASQANTTLAKVLAQYRLPADTPAFARLVELNVERASSFSMLRGFSKVGGVLIGTKPHGSADIRDINWVVSGRKITIGLVDASGRESSLGPFDAGLVHQSLAYAADGRPVAVTMTIAKPVRGLKIFLHPSLVDTPLGCRVQQLDRLVDTYAGEQLPQREKMTEEYYGQVAVYNIALANRMEVIAEKVERKELKEAATQTINEYSETAKEGLRQPSLFSAASILRRKPEFFEPSLIKTAKSCQNQDLNSFEECVRAAYRVARVVRELNKDELRTWSFYPTEIQPWSGVRERSYEVSDDLAFLKSPAGNSVEDRLWPFDFIVQIAFTSAAVNLPEKEQEVYVDRQPIEFDQIKPNIEALVKAGIEKDGFRPQFEDLKDFAILQRLFRSALNGNLGTSFPTLKLAQLTHETAEATSYFHTRRWNLSLLTAFRMRIMEASLLRDRSQPWMERAALKVPACEVSLAKTFGDSRHPGDPSACDFSEFSVNAVKACPTRSRQETPGCLWRSVVAFSAALSQIQETEIAFGVVDDARQDTSGTTCPPLATPSGSVSAKR